MSRIRSAGTQALRVLRGGQADQREQAQETAGAPLRDLLEQPRPGVTAEYVVLPRSLLATMPVTWQQQLADILDELHDATREASWPAAYRVTALRRVRLTDLQETELRRIGVQADYDDDGQLVYRHARSSQPITSPERRLVLAPTTDPLAADAPVNTEGITTSATMT